jgi:molybdate transport system regulatory protein
MQLRLKIWFVFDGGTKLGQGRAALLRLVEEHGSLRRAVQAMGMSYRAAWGHLRELEAAAGIRVLEPAGKGTSAGMRLTPEGRELLAAFERIRTRLEKRGEQEFAAEFPAGKKSRPRRKARRATSPRRKRASPPRGPRR